MVLSPPPPRKEKDESPSLDKFLNSHWCRVTLKRGIIYLKWLNGWLIDLLNNGMIDWWIMNKPVYLLCSPLNDFFIENSVFITLLISLFLNGWLIDCLVYWLIHWYIFIVYLLCGLFKAIIFSGTSCSLPVYSP